MITLSRKSLAFGTVLLTLASSVAHGATDVFDATGDARILSFFVNSNFGNDFLSTFNATGNIQRTLLSFDVSGLNGQTVTSATLRLYGRPFSGAGSADDLKLWRVTKDWVEGEMSWNSAATGQNWSTPGGDAVGTSGVFGSDAYSTSSFTISGLNYQWFEFDATLLVQEWVAGTHANQGMMLTAPEGSFLTYVSSEGTSPDGPNNQNVPQLVVEYDAVPEPLTLLAVVGLVPLAMRRRRPRH